MIEQLYNHFCNHPTISTDTRRIERGSIFFALRGASFDGNTFAIEALKSGAAYAVIDSEDMFAKGGEYRERLILVDDVLTTLQELARHHRRALSIKILAITGSNGKTTTKELLSRVLLQKYKHLYATKGNLNNHIGVPLTLLSMDHTTDFGVVEMGASSCKEIELLCSIAEPNYGIITNVGRAHLGGFGGEAGVRRGKGELLDWLQKHNGVAFIPSENETIISMAQERDGLQFVEYRYSLSDGVTHHLEGEYNRFNVAAAVAVGREFGVEGIEEAIASYIPENNRSQRVESQYNTIIWDCYNANPSSMQVALENFTKEEFSNRNGKVLILGDMFELGEWSKEEHRRVIDLALRSGSTRIYLVGKNFGSALNQDDMVTHFNTRDELEIELKDHPIRGCAILVKGSRGVGLENISIFV